MDAWTAFKQKSFQQLITEESTKQRSSQFAVNMEHTVYAIFKRFSDIQVYITKVTCCIQQNDYFDSATYHFFIRQKLNLFRGNLQHLGYFISQ